MAGLLLCPPAALRVLRHCAAEWMIYAADYIALRVASSRYYCSGGGCVLQGKIVTGARRHAASRYRAAVLCRMRSRACADLAESNEGALRMDVSADVSIWLSRCRLGRCEEKGEVI